MNRQILHYARIAGGLIAPLAIPVLSFVLHQSDVIDIPWIGGAVVVMVLAGFCCGLLLGSPWASAYIFSIWAVWAVASLILDDGRSDPPAEAMVLALLPLLFVPAALAAMVGVLAARLSPSHGMLPQWLKIQRAGAETAEGDR